MDDFVKRQYLTQYKSAGTEALLNAPVNILKGITDKQSGVWALKYDIHNISDLIRNTSHLTPVRLDPELLDSLICYVTPPDYDAGPPCIWGRLFKRAPLNYYVTHPSARFRTKFGPVYYRGRLDGTARVLVVGQDPATDEILGQRILVGDAGQKVQKLLNKLGLTRSYVMVNTFLFGIYGTFDAPMQAINDEATIKNYRNSVFDRIASDNHLEAILAFGKAARVSVDSWPGHVNHPIVEFIHPSNPNDSATLANWNAGIGPAHSHINPDADGTVALAPYGNAFTAADSVAIPRYDLPFGIPDWHGTNGTRSHRVNDTEIAWDAV